MANLSPTASAVVPVTGATLESSYLAGATLARGNSVYLDSATATWKLADTNVSAAVAGSAGLGICLNDAAANQPVTVMIAGSLGLGAILTVGKVYCVSATAGAICPYEDLTTADRVSILGVASTTSNLLVKPWATGVVLA